METLLNKQKVLTDKQGKYKQPTQKLDKEYNAVHVHELG